MKNENLRLLTEPELEELLISESLRFTEGIDKGMCFEELKQIRINLKEIAAEQQRRNN